MRKLSRRFRVERLESRCLCAALEGDDQPTSIASVSLQDQASIDVSEVQGLRGAALEISFDHQRLRVDPRDVRAGSAWGGKGMSIANVDNDEGKINIFVFSARESQLSHGSLVEIDFQRSDGESDADAALPLIDVNRLRLNDNEIFFADAEPTTSNRMHNAPEGLPKLSLQFKIAPEGEGEDEIELATQGQDENFVNLRSSTDAGNTDADHRDAANKSQKDLHNQKQSILLPTVFEDQMSDQNRFASSEDLGSHSGEVCKPFKVASSQVDLAIAQWFGNTGALKGPFMPEVVQDVVVHAALPANSDEAMERGLKVEPLRSEAIHGSEQRVNGFPDFPVVPLVVIHRGFGSEIDPKSASAGGDVLGQLSDRLLKAPLQAEFPRHAIGQTSSAGMYR